jgi:monoamine oxidase
VRRRTVGAAGGLLAGCAPDAAPRWDGGFVGASPERGHRLREPDPGGAPDAVRRVDVVVVGAGVSGLGAARALLRAGVESVAVLELEDTAGGNSRDHAIAGIRCPLGAHYLPTPGPQATEVTELLEDLGVRRTGADGRGVYDERLLGHAPQERLFVDGAWREGLLPPVDALPAGERARTLAQVRAFAAAVRAAATPGAFAVPTARARWTDAHRALDATTFAAWLDARGLDAPALRWYLDYCCRDDYGASTRFVSAWAGLHYFASRHGFDAPGDDRHDDPSEGVLVRPEGNAWLARALAAPLGPRLATGRVVRRVEESKDGVAVDADVVLPGAAGRPARERWLARRAVLATPLHVARRLVAAPPPALASAAARLVHAPWLVANVHLERPLLDRDGVGPAWDSVVYGTDGLGYVDASHQGFRPHPGPTVLTLYRALGGDGPEALAAARRRLLATPWAEAAAAAVAELAEVHPDLPGKATRVDVARWGHAMAVPAPGLRGDAALAALAADDPAVTGRLHLAHSDLAGHSVFEEALFHGTRAGRAAAAALGAVQSGTRSTPRRSAR